MILGDNRLLTSHSWEEISAERHGKLFSSLPPGAKILYIPAYHKKSKKEKSQSFNIHLVYIYSVTVYLVLPSARDYIEFWVCSGNENGIPFAFTDLTELWMPTVV